MKKRFGLIAAALLLAAFPFALAGCGGAADDAASAGGEPPASSDDATGSAPQEPAEPAYTTQAQGPYASGEHHATLAVEGYDPVTIVLDANAAPVTVSNFCALAESGYYDGLALYRIVGGFCMQGGTLGNTASGGDMTLTPIVGEFSDNGHENPLAESFHKGTVAMARTGDPNSATSTFFITLGDNDAVGPSLDGQYAAFGEIDEVGMAVIDKIVADHLQYAPDDGMGVIEDEAHMPIISSITIDD